MPETESLDDVKFLAYLHKRSDGPVKVLTLVPGRQLYADAGLPLWNDRVVETCNINTSSCIFAANSCESFAS